MDKRFITLNVVFVGTTNDQLYKHNAPNARSHALLNPLDTLNSRYP
jgi:hypothetical protein